MSSEADFPNLLWSIEARLNAVEREQAFATRGPTHAEVAEFKSELGKACVQIHKLSEALKASNAEIARVKALPRGVSEEFIKALSEVINERLVEEREYHDREIGKVRGLIGDTVEKSERASRAGAAAISDSLISFSEDFAYGSVN